MLLCHLGRHPEGELQVLEQALREQLTNELGRITLGLAQAELRRSWNIALQREFLDPDDPRSVTLLQGLLACAPLVADVRGGTWAEVLRRRFPKTSSPFGPLDRAGAPHHAVLLIRATRHQVFVLDPYHFGAGQPFAIDYQDFLAQAWTGTILYLP